MIRKVQTENGWVRGLPAADPRITTYKGIPFADKPTGGNRWRAPQPCPDWEGELFACDFAPISMQPITGLDRDNIYSREWAVDTTLPMSEDCLYLNIWAPAEGQTGLPVFVWYFGGGLQVGNTAEMEFDGERIARRGVVVVTVNYRLNACGFLCHPELTAEAPEAPGNFGFLDQQFGTQWVKRNIASFGGDPNQITIGGQSAGGMSVCAQISNVQNEGLFQRAIVQSGMFIPVYPTQFGLCQPLDMAEQRGKRFFDYLGVKTLAEARAIDEHTLWEKTIAWDEEGMWCAAIDGRFCRYDPSFWYLHEDHLSCPLLAGFTDSEFMVAPEVTNPDELAAYADTIPGIDTDAFLACFHQPMTTESIQREGKVSGIEAALRCAASRSSDPVYFYEFSADIPGWDHPGTFHSVDLWFFFETLAKCWRPFVGKHYDLARQMCDYWCHFIKSGNPNGKGSDEKPLCFWPLFSVEEPLGMSFADVVKTQHFPEGEVARQLRLAFLRAKE